MPDLLLLGWLPLIKWTQPAGLARMALFHGGGSLLALAAVWRRGDWPRLRTLFSSPLWGLAAAALSFGFLMAGAVILLYAPIIQPYLPFWLYGLIALFDPLPLRGAFSSPAFSGSAWPDGLMAVLPGWLALAAGSVAEEWIFRVALFWRWSGPPPDPSDGEPGRLPPAAVALKLAGVSAYFAALHWPHAPEQIAIAFLGSLVLGWVLWRTRNFTLVAALHTLFNWKTIR